jgi:hypothetical protein
MICDLSPAKPPSAKEIDPTGAYRIVMHLGGVHSVMDSNDLPAPWCLGHVHGTVHEISLAGHLVRFMEALNMTKEMDEHAYILLRFIVDR